MAKRRKQYRGTPEEHRELAGKWVKDLRADLRRARSELNRNSCAAAQRQLRFAEGSYMAYLAHSPKVTMADRRKGRWRGASGNRALSALWRKYTQICTRHPRASYE